MEEPVIESLDNAIQAALQSATDGVLDPGDRVNGLVFLAIAAGGLAMALVYVPLRIYLTVTSRSRRLKLLQRIRRLRDELSSSGSAPPP